MECGDGVWEIEGGRWVSIRGVVSDVSFVSRSVRHLGRVSRATVVAGCRRWHRGPWRGLSSSREGAGEIAFTGNAGEAVHLHIPVRRAFAA